MISGLITQAALLQLALEQLAVAPLPPRWRPEVIAQRRDWQLLIEAHHPAHLEIR